MIRILVFTLATLFVYIPAESTPFPAFKSLGPRIKLNAMTDRDSVHSGDEIRLYLSVQIEEGWHIYSLHPLDGNELLATQIILEKNAFQSIGDWQESKAHLIQDDAQDKLVKGHTATVEFYRDFIVPEKIISGSYCLKGKLLYRACDNKLCTLPQGISFDSPIQVDQAHILD